MTSRDTPDRVPVEDKNLVPGAGSPRVYLHIGEPKTGTTYLQHVVWGNRSRLAERGIMLPGYSRRDHNRASRDVREAQQMASDPSDPWIGEWDVLTGQALRAPEAALISDEILVACTPAQADRAVRSLLSAELHIILTVRDLSSLLPAEWQESIKTYHTVPWEQWLGDITASEPAADRRGQSWFWTAHDTLATLGMWSQHLPPDRVHVITMPRHGSTDELWERFASVLGIDPGGFDLSVARANTSLGLAETEFLRRMNEAVVEEIPHWYYTRYLKQLLAHDVLTEQQRRVRLVLPPGLEAWTSEQSKRVVAGLRDSKHHIVGDLRELLPEPAADPYTAPDDQPTEQLLEVAVHVAAVLAESRYREMYPAPRPRPRLPGPRQMVSRMKWTTLNGRRTRRMLRNASHRPAVRRLRVAIWWTLMRPTQHRKTVGASGSGPAAAWLAGGRPGLGGRNPEPVAGPAEANPAGADED